VQKRRRILRERGGIRIQEPEKGGTRVLWCLVKGKGRGKDGLAWGRLRGLDSYMDASELRGVAIGGKGVRFGRRIRRRSERGWAILQFMRFLFVGGRESSMGKGGGGIGGRLLGLMKGFG
jgi:hypothetical protein